MTLSPEQVAWINMRSRCYNENTWYYQYYGARGINVCDRWYYSFENFLKDMGPKPSPKHSLDRINNNGNYQPDNCHWTTWKQQRKNRREIKLRNKTTTKLLDLCHILSKSNSNGVFSLPQKATAKQMKCDRTVIRDRIKLFIKRGILEVVDGKYSRSQPKLYKLRNQSSIFILKTLSKTSRPQKIAY